MAQGPGAALTWTCRSSTATPDVLKRMKRPASGEKNLDRIQRWREACPDIVIRSTFIAGLSGRDGRRIPAPARLPARGRKSTAQGCFAYSDVNGAAANELPGMLPLEVRERRARFMAVAEEVSIAKLQRRVGATMQVLIDCGPRPWGAKGGVGRSYADAPEIDGTVQLLPPEKNQQSSSRWASSPGRASSGVQRPRSLVAQPI